MSTEAAKPPPQANVSIEAVLETQQHTLINRIFATQSFWVAVALALISIFMSWYQPDSFATADNFFNITRNFSFIGVMALGMTPVIITGGIDLSVGSVMGLVAIVCGLVLLKQPIDYMPDWWNSATWTHTWWMAVVMGLAAGALMGLVNGVLIAYVGLPPFVVTLGMLSAVRSLAVVLSESRMLYDFRPDQAATFKSIGGGDNFGRRLEAQAFRCLPDLCEAAAAAMPGVPLDDQRPRGLQDWLVCREEVILGAFQIHFHQIIWGRQPRHDLCRVNRFDQRHRAWWHVALEHG